MLMRPITIAILFAFLPGAVYVADICRNRTDVGMPPAGSIALGISSSILLACGLMALMFYSSRHGYDDPPQPKAPPGADNSSGPEFSG